MLRLLALAVLTSSAMAGQVRAQEPELELQGELPFSVEELREAIHLRRPILEALQGRSLSIRGTGTTVSLGLGPLESSLDLGATRGPEAARLVALLVADLALEDRAGATASPEQAAPEPSAAPPSRALARQATREDASDPELPDRLWTRIALTPSVGKGAAELDPWTLALELGVSQAVRPWLFEVGIAWWAAPKIGRPGFASGWNAARMRLQGGLRLGVFELLAGPSLSPFWVLGGDGHHGVLFAIGGTARAALRISDELEALVTLGVDVFPHRVELQAHGVDVIATPRVAPFAGLGIGWRSS